MPMLKAKDEKPVCRQVTRALVSNVQLALQSMTFLPGNIDPPFWIDGAGPFPANEVLPMRNALVHLPGVVTGDMADPTRFVIEPTPRFFSTYALDFDFNLDADPPAELIKFLVSVWPNDPESINALQEWVGYCLLPDTRQQKIGMFIGPMRSGRGTIARLMSALIGPENVAGPRLSALATNFGLEPLVGKPLAIIGDARLSGRTDTGAIVEAMLSISGEDTVTIDRKHRAPWTGKLPTRLMLLSNELPRLPDQSGGSREPVPRLRLVHKVIPGQRGFGDSTRSAFGGAAKHPAFGQSRDGSAFGPEGISFSPNRGPTWSIRCATSPARSVHSSGKGALSRLDGQSTWGPYSPNGADGASRRNVKPGMRASLAGTFELWCHFSKRRCEEGTKARLKSRMSVSLKESTSRLTKTARHTELQMLRGVTRNFLLHT